MILLIRKLSITNYYFVVPLFLFQVESSRSKDPGHPQPETVLPFASHTVSLLPCCLRCHSNRQIDAVSTSFILYRCATGVFIVTITLTFLSHLCSSYLSLSLSLYLSLSLSIFLSLSLCFSLSLSLSLSESLPVSLSVSLSISLSRYLSDSTCLS